MKFLEEARRDFASGTNAFVDTGEQPFALWEVRSTLHLDHGGGRRFSADGGCRVEWRGGHRFVVGAGPGALEDVARGAARSTWDAPGWDRAVEHAEAGQQQEAEAIARALGRLESADFGAGSRMLGWRATFARRSRIWLGGSPQAPPTAETRTGWSARIEYEVDSRGVAFDLLGEEIEGDFGAVRRRILRRLQREARLAGASVAAFKPPCDGEIILQPEAAGWWVHEMAHAALERRSEESPRESAGRDALGEGVGSPASAGPVIVDDPGLGTWPAGFTHDDLGREVRPLTLWPATERGEIGHARRSSIRDAAGPGLACTIYSGGAASSARWSEEDGTVWVETIRSGRFDPPSRVLFLEAADLYRLSHGRLWVFPGPWTLMVGAENGWGGSVPVASEQDAERSRALCTRLGRTNSVMVGAPTIRLEGVHLVRPPSLRI